MHLPFFVTAFVTVQTCTSRPWKTIHMLSQDDHIPFRNETSIAHLGIFKFGPINTSIPLDPPKKNESSILTGPVAPIKPLKSPSFDPPKAYNEFVQSLVSRAANAIRPFLTPEQIHDLRQGFPIAIDAIHSNPPESSAQRDQSYDGLIIKHISYRDKHRFFKGTIHASEDEPIIEFLTNPLTHVSIVIANERKVGGIIHTRYNHGNSIELNVIIIDRNVDITPEEIIQAFYRQAPKGVSSISFANVQVKFQSYSREDM